MRIIYNPGFVYLITIVMMLITSTVIAQTRTSSPHWKYMANTRINWQAYGEQAFALAKKRGRPLFVLIYADWCEWCEKYEIETLETDIIRKEIQSKFIPVAVDIDAQPELAKQLGATLVPASLILTPDAKKLIRFYGVASAADLSETLGQVLTAWRQGRLPAADDFGDVSTCCPTAPPP